MTSPRSLGTRSLVLLALALVLAFAITGCGDDKDSGTSTADSSSDSAKLIASDSANGSTTLTIGSKNFTEQKVLGEIYAQALEAAGYKVKTELNLGDEKTALKSLKDGTISGYPEYTGTALLSFFAVPSDKLPTDPTEAYNDVKANFAKEDIVAFKPTPFTSSNEVALTKEKADELGVTNISDLKGKSEDLTLYGTPECRQRLDCLLGLQKVYGLQFKKFVPVDPSLRHEVLEKDQADVSIVFTTDPQNKRDNLVLLKDDKGMFPPYNSTFLANKTTVDKAGPDFQGTIENVNTGLTAPVIQELNARVDLDKETPAAAAKSYLTEEGYIK
jgi:glycine betaine/choline ABC-type transport system substrate-binding protein